MGQLKFLHIWTSDPLLPSNHKINMIFIILSLLLLTASSLHEGFYQRIQQDLEPFKQGITPDMLNRAASQPFTCRVVLRDGDLQEPHCSLIEAH
jgi:hypothetical protein